MAVDGVGPGASDETVQTVLKYLHFATPVILIVYFLAAFTCHSIATASEETTVEHSSTTGPGGKPLPRNTDWKKNGLRKRPAPDFTPATKIAFNWLTVGAVLTFVLNAVAVILHALVDRENHWWCGQDMAVYIVASFVIYGLVLISLIDSKPSPTVAHCSTWGIALVLELILLGASIADSSRTYREPSATDPEGGMLRRGVTEWEAIEILISIVRIVFLLAFVGLYLLFTVLQRVENKSASPETPGTPTEATSLLNGHQAENGNANGHVYGATVENGTTQNGAAEEAPTDTKAEAPWKRPDKIPPKSWWEYLRGYSLFFPYIWPAKSPRLQVTFVLCLGLVLLARVVNVLVVWQIGEITNALAGEDGYETRIPWLGICLYIFFRILQGSSGLIGAVRSTLWIPISQYSYQELSTAAFEHVHSLSLDFHLGKKTGEVLSALSKGNAINNFLEQITFSVVPMLIDLAVAIGYFLIKFDAYYALVIAVVTIAYLYVTIRLAQWRAEIRREMVNASRQEDAVKNDSMVSYETVKYFNAETYEFKRYRDAVQAFQNAEYKVLLSLNLMNVCQNIVFTAGLLITTIIAAYQVTSNQRKVGDFVSLVSYMTQLQSPLSYFGTFYRMIQSTMINSERMLELFKEQPIVVDKPNARDFPSCQGDIRFNDVHFAYDPRKPALKGVSFRCAPGTTTAFVGESGGGKSTIFRLLFRFYNLTGGSIQVDGHDVNELKIDAFRRHIGVVPQDAVLFNESLMYNLKYANEDATNEDVHAACRAASIHDKILHFADGYDARVGERGLKLSGGEKQRVAIARAILKKPRIILLDEATAALDTDTEEHIQEYLEKLSHGRTTLVIAHRLSTITTADQIVVLHQGQVIEMGNHESLLAAKGKYASMWKKQIRAQRAAEVAKVLHDRAEKLRKEASGDVGKGEASEAQSEDERQQRPHNDSVDQKANSRSRSSSFSSSDDEGSEPTRNTKDRAGKHSGSSDTSEDEAAVKKQNFSEAVKDTEVGPDSTRQNERGP